MQASQASDIWALLKPPYWRMLVSNGIYNKKNNNMPAYFIPLAIGLLSGGAPSLSAPLPLVAAALPAQTLSQPEPMRHENFIQTLDAPKVTPSRAAITSPPKSVAAATVVAAPVITTPAPTPVAQAKTQSLLQNIPAGLISPSAVETTIKPFAIKRSDVADLTLEEPTVKTHEAMGISIQLKQPQLQVQDYLQRAFELTQQKQYVQAVAYYQAILAAKPNQLEAMVGLASIAHYSGEIDKALQLYEQALRQDADNPTVWRNLLILASQEPPAQATERLEALRLRNPDFAAIPAQLGILYHQAGQNEQAVQMMSEAIQLDQQNLTFWQYMASFLEHAGSQKQAIMAYKRVYVLMNEQKTDLKQRAAIQERLTFLLSNRS